MIWPDYVRNGDRYNSSPNEGIMIRRAVLVPVLVAIAVEFTAAKQEKPSSFEGAITGVVLTEDGRPASDFKVCLQFGDSLSTGLVPLSQGDLHEHEGTN